MTIHDLPAQREERSEPSDVAAERAVLGSMMLSASAVDDALATLTGEEFYEHRHTAIWAAIAAMANRGERPDPLTVSAALLEAGDLVRIGGQAYLHSLVTPEVTPTASNAGMYARTVREMARKRRWIVAGQRLAAVGWDPTLTAEEADALADREIRAAGAVDSAKIVPIAQMVDRVFEGIEAAREQDGKLVGIPTGFIDLDRLTGGFRPGQLIVIGARPAIGKTTLAADIARAAAIHYGIATRFQTLEMSAEEMMQRLLSAEARVMLQAIRKGQLRDGDWEKLRAARARIDEAPLFIDDTPDATLPAMRAAARALTRNHKRAVLIVDYLQLMSSGQRVESRQQEVSQFSRGLKLLAKEFEIPVIALSQLNRGSEMRKDKIPQMSDLRESGSVEQDADIVILLHREDAYEKESPRAGEADLIVAKHRNGPTETITVAFQGHFSRFVDMAK